MFWVFSSFLRVYVVRFRRFLMSFGGGTERDLELDGCLRRECVVLKLMEATDLGNSGS